MRGHSRVGGTLARRYWILGLWLLFIPLYLWAGARPDHYQIDVFGMQPFYSWPGVLTVMAVTTIEAAVLYAITRPSTYRRSWKRALGGLALFTPWLFASAVLLMHAPAYLFVHFLWVLSVSVILLGLCIAEGVTALLLRVRAPRT